MILSTAQRLNLSTLNVRLSFRKAEDFLAFLELAALLQEFDTLETFQDVPLRRDRAGAFETAMLRHKCSGFLGGRERAPYSGVPVFQPHITQLGAGLPSGRG